MEAIQGQTRVLGEHHRVTARTRVNFSGLLLRQRRYAEAEFNALLAYEAFRAALGESNGATQDAVKRLVDIYDQTSAKGDAAIWRAKLIPITNP